jgi:serine/threonine protein kinase/formylglycine-generating enzyme required for sulfatase activity
LYARYLTRRHQGESLSFESWCVEHPSEADDLRRLHGQYEQWKSIFERLSSSAGGAADEKRLAGEKRLADELREQYGEGVDPGISLDGGKPGDDSGPSSELLRRLRSHAPSNSRYKLLGEVGRGGMGAVIRVWDEDLRRTLAMKVVLGKEDKSARGATPPVDSRTLGRFLEEAQITGQLDHPGIVPVHELGLGSDGQVYFTMRLVKGEDLRAIYGHVESGHEEWNTTRALSVMLKVCEAMAYAHSKGVIHRDLKPANIMVGKYGEVYVMDWGLARVAGQKDLHDLRLKDQLQPGTSQSVRTERREERAESPDSPLVTMDGDVMGTPAYMPPEQARGELAQLGPHSDVYAVGAMLYHLLLVRYVEMPYVPRGARMSQHRVLMSVIEDAPKSIVSYDKTIPAPLVAIVEKAMSRDISRRYRDMEALSKDLRAYIEGRVVQAYETGTWAETKQWVKRNKPLAASLAAGVLVLVGGVALVLQQSARANQSAREANTEREKTAAANATLPAQAREQKLRGMIQEVARFRAQCRTTDGLDRLGKPAYQWWLDEAARLLNGVAEDREKSVEWQPGLADVRAKLAELRASPSVLPYTEDDRTRDFESHPERRRLRELEAEAREAGATLREPVEELEQEIAGLESRLRVQVFPADADVAAKYAAELASSDASALNEVAWPLVAPDEDRPEPDQLVRAMLLARRGVELSSEAKSRAMVRKTYAWSLLWLGRFDEAIAQSQKAVEESENGDELVSNLTRIREEVASWSGAARAEREAELAQKRVELAARKSSLEADIAAKKAEYERRLAALREVCFERRTWRFSDSQLEWLHERLTKLESELLWLSQMNEAAVAAHLTEKAQSRWSEAIEGIARSPKYAGRKWPSGERLTPQAGLLPLGENPVTGLWEFVHLQTGVEPELGADVRVLRDAEGRLSLTPETGMVLVLLPGGRVPRANSKDREQEDWIPNVELSPFFLSKYELTADQWDRVSLRRGMHYTGGKSLTPANTISWDDISAMWSRELGWCGFPSEAQWVYGCRAGTATRWWTGNDAKSLVGAANVDHDNKNSTDIQPVNTLRANGFGLHDVHGNVWEWCGDTYFADASPRVGDGLRDDGVESSVNRVLRGGSWINSPANAGSARRDDDPPEYRDYVNGLRPSRRITP